MLPSHNRFRRGIVGILGAFAIIGILFVAGCGSSNTATVGPPTKLAFTVQPGNVAAGTSITPAVTVSIQDAQGNVVTTATNQITMAIGTNPSSATLGGTTQVAAVAGVATFSNLSINNPGTGYTLAASATGLTSATSNAFNAIGPPTKLAFTVQPSNVAAGASITPAVAVSIEDAAGNVVTSATSQITIAIGANPSSGTLSGTATVAAVSGVATFSTLKINKTGTAYTLTASATGLTGATSNAFNVTTGVAAQLVFTTQPSTTVAGGAITAVVSIQDSQGNLVTSATNQVTIAIGPGSPNGTLNGTKQVNAVAGVATFSALTMNSAGTGYTLAASATGLTGVTSSVFNVTVGPEAKLAFTIPPSSVAANASISPAVTVSVQDAFGNLVATATDSITIAIGTNPSGGTLSGTTSVPAVAGVAAFSSLSIDNAGTGYTLTANATGGLTGTTSSAFNVFGTATKLAFTVQPSNVAAGSSINPAVTVSVEDALGSVVTTATNQITIAIGTNPSSGTLSGTTPVTAVAGVATFSDLRINNTGTGYTLTASGTLLTGATSGTFNVTVANVCPTGGNLALLTGQYAFTMSGYDSGGPMALGGVFDADGAGHIATTVGVEDFDRISGNTTQATPLTINAAGSSYTMGTDNRGCLTIVTGSGGSAVTSVFRFAVGSVVSGVATKGRLIEFDSTGTTGAGVVKLQTKSAFSTGQVTGNYAFGIASGATTGGSSFAAAGSASLSAGSITSGFIDTNDGGNINNGVGATNAQALTGSYTIDGTTGRTKLTFTVGSGGSVAAGYVVSPTELLVISLDPLTGSNAGAPYTGSILQQSGTPFANSSLNGSSVAATVGITSNGSGPVTKVQLGIFTVSVSGTLNFNVNSAWDGTTLTTDQANTLNYNVTSNGRVTFTGQSNPPIFYLVSANKGFFLGTSSKVDSGFFEPQTTTTFSPPKTFFFSTVNPALSSVGDSVGVATFIAAGNAISGTSDNNDGTNLVGSQTFNSTYTAFDVNGRATIITGGNGTIIYLISPTKAVLLDATSTNAAYQIAEQ